MNLLFTVSVTVAIMVALFFIIVYWFYYTCKKDSKIGINRIKILKKKIASLEEELHHHRVLVGALFTVGESHIDEALKAEAVEEKIKKIKKSFG